MHVNGNRQTPTPDQFSLEEFHSLATNPDFEVRLEHAKKLGVASFEQTRDLLQQPFSYDNLKSLFAHTREQILWILGDQHPGFSRLKNGVCDDKIAYLIEAQKSLREPMQNLLSALRFLCNEDEKQKLDLGIDAILREVHSEAKTAMLLFQLAHDVIPHKWEQKATKTVHQRGDYFAQRAADKESAHFANYTCDQFAKGQTGRWIGRVIEAPAKHGLSNSGLSGTLAVHHLQTALLCDVICQRKDIDARLLPETLVFDVDHLLSLRAQFKNMVFAQRVADFYTPVLGRTCDKNEILKTVLFALEEKDDSLGLNLSEPELAKLKALASNDRSPAADLHRSRLRKLLESAVDKGRVDKEQAKTWHYEGIVDKLDGFNAHLNWILRVHFPVFVNLYNNLLENTLLEHVWFSLFSNDGNPAWRDWVSADDQVEAEEIRRNFRSTLEQLRPYVLANMQAALPIRLKHALLDGQKWGELNELLVVGHNGDSTKLVSEMNALYLRTQTFNILLQKRRLEQCKDEMLRKPPSQIRSGFR